MTANKQFSKDGSEAAGREVLSLTNQGFAHIGVSLSFWIKHENWVYWSVCNAFFDCKTLNFQNVDPLAAL